jgi:hypothetical protein
VVLAAVAVIPDVWLPTPVILGPAAISLAARRKGFRTLESVGFLRRAVDHCGAGSDNQMDSVADRSDHADLAATK